MWAVARIIPILAALAACDSELEAPPPERVRAIKPYHVNEPAGGDVRRYSGEIVPSDTSVLSFAVAGTVASVAVTAGEKVEAGQVLARLDPKRFQLDVEASRSELTAARAKFVDKRSTLDRQRKLFEKGWVARAALDQATAAFEAAEGEVNLARARLGTAERDFANTSLSAPFDGVIASRNIEPFEEVSIGKAAFLVNSKGAMEVDLTVPDAIVQRLAVGLPAQVEVATLAGCGCTGRVSEIGATSGAAGAVAVKVALLAAESGLLSGMTAEVKLVLSGSGSERGFLVPLAAIAPGDQKADGYVFKFDGEAGVVRRVPIKGGHGASENLIEIVDGIGSGDIVAAAGVSFLRDGQRVKLLGQ